MAHFEFAGRTYPLVTSYTFEEARTIKRITGMTLAEVDSSFASDGTDPDCIFALFLVSVQRMDPARSENEISKVKMEDVRLVVEEDTSDSPPTEAAGDGN